MSMCGVSVRPWAYFQNYMSNLHEIFYAFVLHVGQIDYFSGCCPHVCMCMHLQGRSVHAFPTGLPQTFSCKCYLWPWLGPPLAALQYAKYFCFFVWRVCTWWPGVGDEKRHVLEKWFNSGQHGFDTVVYSHTDQPCSLVSVMALLQLLHVLQSRAPRHGTHLGSVHPPHRTLCPHQLLQHRRYQNAAPLHQRLNAHLVVVVVPLENHVAVHARNCDCVWVTSCIHKVHLTHTPI